MMMVMMMMMMMMMMTTIIEWWQQNDDDDIDNEYDNSNEGIYDDYKKEDGRGFLSILFLPDQ